VKDRESEHDHAEDMSGNATYNPPIARREVYKRKARTVCARRVMKVAVRRVVKAGSIGTPTRISHGFARPSL
jgi:ribosomal protein S3